MSVTSGVSGCGNPYLIHINTGSDDKANDLELKRMRRERTKKKVEEVGKEKALEDYIKQRAEKTLRDGANDTRYIERSHNRWLEKTDKRWCDREKYPQLNIYFEDIVRTEKFLYKVIKDLKANDTKMKQLMSKLEPLQTLSHQDEAQKKMIEKLTLNLKTLEAYKKDLQDQKDKLDWKNHDIITEFKKEADNIRIRVLSKEPVLYDIPQPKKKAPPVKPVKSGRLAIFSKFFGLSSNSELDFDNIAQFSEPRENRCTYI